MWRRTVGIAETLEPLDHLVDGHAGQFGGECDNGRSGIAAADHIGFGLAPFIGFGVCPLHCIGVRSTDTDHAATHKACFVGRKDCDPAVKCSQFRRLAIADVDRKAHVDYGDEVVIGEAVQEKPPVMVIGATENDVASAQGVAALRIADPEIRSVRL